MASREYARKPAPHSPELRTIMNSSRTVERADVVASVAHGAIGQRRADRVTPYIDHPRRAATLVLQWQGAGVIALDDAVLERCVAAALLHDVLEDTKLPRSELEAHFSDDRALLNLVETMTEIEGDPDHPDYYRNIGRDREAVIVKCADRCANLEDVIKDVRQGNSVERWQRYLRKTHRDVEPLLEGGLLAELRKRLEAAESLLTF
ncbi:MAG: bifunctional (p)ppGpp synthetase/guanosine-3',5'-bis(diphosphate) 3'-pyrophosphohydrolase [Candidatus Eremiobacteraeota bacterium]|nr:bifunctional (p)ppGpp synthetase/guanosine-3',5'-bis(diphosphate) 3'-pyrophosphohydrolase [Candidatus Eremiobacteraeota bacterium]